MKKRLTVSLLALALLCACAAPAGESAPPAQTSPAPLPSLSPGPVFTDWSKLEEYAPRENLYTRYYEQPTDLLIPVEGGYGAPLIPFTGAVREVDWGWTEHLYGLATPDGVVVCDPVYNSVYQPSLYSDALQAMVNLDEYLVLGYTGYEPGEEEGTALITLAAWDGSWVLDGDYIHAFPLEDGRVLLLDEEETFWLCDSAGSLTPSPLTVKPSEVWGEWWREMGGFLDGVACLPAPGDEDADWGENGSWLLNALTGETKYLPEVTSCNNWNSGNELADAFTNESQGHLAGFLDRQGNWVIPPTFLSVDTFQGDYARAHPVTGGAVLIDTSGEVALTLQGDGFYSVPAFDGTPLYWDYTLDGETGQCLIHGIYDGELNLLTDHPALGRTLDSLYSVPAYREGDGWVICDKDGTYEVETDGEVFSAIGARIIFYDDSESYGIYDCIAGKWIVPLGEYGYVRFAGTGDDTLYWASAPGKWGDSLTLLDAHGDVLTHVSGQVYELNGGYLEVTDDLGSGWLDTQGNWVFRWVFPLGTD